MGWFNNDNDKPDRSNVDAPGQKKDDLKPGPRPPGNDNEPPPPKEDK